MHREGGEKDELMSSMDYGGDLGLFKPNGGIEVKYQTGKCGSITHVELIGDGEDQVETLTISKKQVAWGVGRVTKGLVEMFVWR